MTPSYQICCSVEFKHSYYRENRLKDIQVMPDQGTQHQINQLDIRFRMVGNVLSIFFNPQKAAAQGVSHFPNLSFSLQLTDPYFFNVTDLPLDKAASTYTFQNETGKNSLSKGSIVSGADIDSDPTASITQTFGKLSLSLAVPTADGPAPVYELSFAAKKTIWRYYIIDASNQFEDLRIETTDIPGGFSKQGKQTIPGGQEAVMFRSDPASPIPLAEDPKQKISLMNGSEVVIQPLPYPSAQQIISVQEDGQTRIYSDVYVYV